MALSSSLELHEIDSATFTGNYQLVGTLTNPAYKVIISNMSAVAVYISTNGVDNMIHLGAGQWFELTPLDPTITRNKAEYLFSTGTEFYVSGAVSVGYVAFNAQTTG